MQQFVCYNYYIGIVRVPASIRYLFFRLVFCFWLFFVLCFFFSARCRCLGLTFSSNLLDFVRLYFCTGSMIICEYLWHALKFRVQQLVRSQSVLSFTGTHLLFRRSRREQPKYKNHRRFSSEENLPNEPTVPLE